MTCDIKINDTDYCENEAVHFGRWLGYCEEHKTVGKQLDREKTWDNELSHDLASGNMDYINADPELQDVLLES